MRWRKGRVLGTGSFGTVYLALNDDSGDLMAAKEVVFDMNRTEVVDGLRQEIDILRSLKDDHIVRYIGTEVRGNRLFVFTEWVPGGSIHTLMQQFGGKLPTSVVRTYTRQMLEGLAYLHREKVVHCDIKPANILVDNESTVKLADFGASRKLSNVRQWERLASTATLGDDGEDAEDVQQAPRLHGTPYFLSPELIRTQDYTHTSDIWALGGTVLQMATGRPPWQELRCQSVPELLMRVSNTSDPPYIPDSLPDELRHFLLRCFALDARDRPAAAQLLDDPFVHRSRGRGPVVAALATLGFNSLPRQLSTQLSRALSTDGSGGAADWGFGQQPSQLGTQLSGMPSRGYSRAFSLHAGAMLLGQPSGDQGSELNGPSTHAKRASTPASQYSRNGGEKGRSTNGRPGAAPSPAGSFGSGEGSRRERDFHTPEMRARALPQGQHAMGSSDLGSLGDNTPPHSAVAPLPVPVAPPMAPPPAIADNVAASTSARTPRSVGASAVSATPPKVRERRAMSRGSLRQRALQGLAASVGHAPSTPHNTSSSGVETSATEESSPSHEHTSDPQVNPFLLQLARAQEQGALTDESEYDEEGEGEDEGTASRTEAHTSTLGEEEEEGGKGAVGKARRTPSPPVSPAASLPHSTSALVAGGHAAGSDAIPNTADHPPAFSAATNDGVPTPLPLGTLSAGPNSAVYTAVTPASPVQEHTPVIASALTPPPPQRMEARGRASNGMVGGESDSVHSAASSSQPAMPMRQPQLRMSTAASLRMDEDEGELDRELQAAGEEQARPGGGGVEGGGGEGAVPPHVQHPSLYEHLHALAAFTRQQTKEEDEARGRQEGAGDDRRRSREYQAVLGGPGMGSSWTRTLSVGARGHEPDTGVSPENRDASTWSVPPTSAPEGAAQAWWGGIGTVSLIPMDQGRGRVGGGGGGGRAEVSDAHQPDWSVSAMEARDDATTPPLPPASVTEDRLPPRGPLAFTGASLPPPPLPQSAVVGAGGMDGAAQWSTGPTAAPGTIRVRVEPLPEEPRMEDGGEDEERIQRFLQQRARFMRATSFGLEIADDGSLVVFEAGEDESPEGKHHNSWQTP